MSTAEATPAGHADGLLAQHQRDSQELRRLCEARDEARRERDAARNSEAAALDLLSRMRFACGDKGKRMQDELEQYLREQQANAQRYQELRCGQHWSVIDGVGEALRAEGLDAAIDAASARAAKEGGTA